MSRNRIGHLIAGIVLCAGFHSSVSAPPAHAQTLEWVRQFGTTGPEDSYDAAADSLGNVYIAGGFGAPEFYQNYQIYPGYVDAFLTKYDAAGNFQWTQHFSTDQADVAHSVSADGLGNVYIAGGTGGYGGPDAFHDTFIAKYDAAGSLQWTRELGTGNFYHYANVSADSLGNVFIAGEGRPGYDGPYDIFVGKYDAAGNSQWIRQLGTSTFDTIRGISADGLGNVYMSGGGPNAGGRDAFIGKYDGAGNLLWTRQLGTPEQDQSTGVSADRLGNVYFSGYTDGNLAGPNAGDSDAFVGAYDSDGNPQWIKQFGTPGLDGRDGSVAADGQGNVYLSGSLSSGPYSQSSFLRKYDAEGALKWTKVLDQRLEDVSTDGLGNIYLRGGIQVRPGALNPFEDPGDSDVLVAKYIDCGGCEPPPVPPIVVDLTISGEVWPGTLVSHQFTTSFGDLPVTWSNLVSYSPTDIPPVLSESGLFSWQTSELDVGGLYHFDVTATNAGGSDTGRLTLRLAFIPEVPEPSAVLLVWLGICIPLLVTRVRD